MESDFQIALKQNENNLSKFGKTKEELTVLNSYSEFKLKLPPTSFRLHSKKYHEDK